jgi:hypothetical protein
MLQNINLNLRSVWVNICQNVSPIRKFCYLDLDEIGGQFVSLCTFQIWVVNLPGFGGSTSRHLQSQLHRNQHHSNQIGSFAWPRYRRFRSTAFSWFVLRTPRKLSCWWQLFILLQYFQYFVNNKSYGYEYKCKCNHTKKICK